MLERPAAKAVLTVNSAISPSTRIRVSGESRSGFTRRTSFPKRSAAESSGRTSLRGSSLSLNAATPQTARTNSIAPAGAPRFHRQRSSTSASARDQIATSRTLAGRKNSPSATSTAATTAGQRRAGFASFSVPRPRRERAGRDGAAAGASGVSRRCWTTAAATSMGSTNSHGRTARLGTRKLRSGGMIASRVRDTKLMSMLNPIIATRLSPRPTASARCLRHGTKARSTSRGPAA